MNRLIVYVCISILLCGCNQQRRVSSNEVKEVLLTSVKYENDPVISPPYSLDVVGDNLMLFFPNGDKFVKTFSKEDLSLVDEWGKFGNGPDEFTSVQYCGSLNDGNKLKLYLYDFNLRTLREYVVTEEGKLKISSTKSLKDEDLYVSNLHVLNQDYFLGSVVFGKDAPIVLLDRDLNIVSNFGNIEERPEKGVGSQSYVGRFASDGSRFVYAMNDFGYLACYEIKDGNVNQKWNYYMEKPLFDEFGSLDKKRLLDGFWDVTIKNEKVYAIYNGKNDSERKNIGGDRFPTLILAFDIQTGTLCEKYRTDRDLTRFCMDENGVIYGVGVNPEVEVVRYKR
jgi:hypothetical protein